jgi:hypothetical protein
MAVALLGAGWAGYTRVAATSARSAQIFVTMDHRLPEQVRILLNVVAPLPIGRTYSDEAMVCDGVTLRYGQETAPVPLGYFGTIPARAAGQAYRCIFHHWTGDATFIIPALTTITPSFTAPASGANLALDQPLALKFASNAPADSSNEYMPDIWATDSQMHYTMPNMSGLGPGGGTATFGPPGRRGFQPGPGTLMLVHTLRGARIAVAGWSGVGVIDQIGVSLPVVWV